jgi:hypothetical protein
MKEETKEARKKHAKMGKHVYQENGMVLCIYEFTNNIRPVVLLLHEYNFFQPTPVTCLSFTATLTSCLFQKENYFYNTVCSPGHVGMCHIKCTSK